MRIILYESDFRDPKLWRDLVAHACAPSLPSATTLVLEDPAKVRAYFERALVHDREIEALVPSPYDPAKEMAFLYECPKCENHAYSDTSGSRVDRHCSTCGAVMSWRNNPDLLLPGAAGAVDVGRGTLTPS